MQRAVFFLTVCLALMLCAPVYKTVVEKDYESQKIHDATLIIAPPINLTIDYFGNVKDEFGEGDPQKLIFKHFKEVLLKKLVDYSTFSSAAFDTFSKCAPLFTRSNLKWATPMGLQWIYRAIPQPSRSQRLHLILSFFCRTWRLELKGSTTVGAKTMMKQARWRNRCIITIPGNWKDLSKTVQELWHFKPDR